ncbi:hypothetical protein [Cryobacterium sp. Y62]|nr:hypothetical protein [Cryobacterium sp. Y62]
MDRRVEVCDALPIGGEDVGVVVFAALDDAVGTESGKVGAHLVSAVVSAK